MLNTDALIEATEALGYPERGANTPEGRAAFVEARRAHDAAEQALITEWSLWLADDNLDANIAPEAAQLVFRQAWEQGHSSGYSEVESNYVDLAEIVNTAVRTAIQNLP